MFLWTSVPKQAASVKRKRKEMLLIMIPVIGKTLTICFWVSFLPLGRGGERERLYMWRKNKLASISVSVFVFHWSYFVWQCVRDMNWRFRKSQFPQSCSARSSTVTGTRCLCEDKQDDNICFCFLLQYLTLVWFKRAAWLTPLYWNYSRTAFVIQAFNKLCKESQVQL